MNGRDLVAESCGQLASYLPLLRRLTPEPPAPDGAPVRPGRPAAGSPPGNLPAFYAKTAVEATALNLEGILLYAAGKRRGGPLAARSWSDASIGKALDAITRLIDAADDDTYALVITELDARLRDVRCVPDIDEERRWRALPRRAGEALPPRCPYCGMFELRADMDARPAVVECRFPGCRDRAGNWPPRAELGTDEHGRPVLLWADGLTELAPDADGPR